jgi:hypothetical protein
MKRSMKYVAFDVHQATTSAYCAEDQQRQGGSIHGVPIHSIPVNRHFRPIGLIAHRQLLPLICL